MSRNNFRTIKNRTVEHTVLDALGRPLAEGDSVMIPASTGTCVWQVAQITPKLAPNLPPGATQVVLRAQSVQLLPGGQLTQMVLVVPFEPPPDAEVAVDEKQNGNAQITIHED